MSSSRSRDSIKNITKRCWTWGRTRNAVSAPSSKTSSRTASCSGAGWTGRFGLGGFHQPQPCPPTCRCRRWDRRTTRRRFSTSLRRPRRHVGGPRWTGQCASFHCCPGRRSWRRSSCQFRTSWSTTTWSEPSFSGSAGTPSNIASASDRWSWGKTAGPSWWLISSGTRAADGCWPAKATSTRSSTAWCWNSSLRGCPRRPRSGYRMDLAIQLAEDQMAACHGVGGSLPSVSLSLPPSSSFSPPSFLPRSRAGVLPRAQLRWRGGPAPESAAVRAHAREAGSASPSSALFPVPLGSPRQFLGPLPATRVAGKPGPACWRCGDPGHFIDRCPMMEVGTLVRVPDAPQAAPDQAGGYQIPVSIRGGTYWALVDSGCNQTSIHQSLIQPEALDKSCMVRVRCVHGDVVKYPVVLLAIQFRGQKHKVEVAVNPRLRHPLILGTNWPAFKILLGVLCVDASCGKEKPEGEAAVRTGEAEPGPAEAAPGERSAVERLILTERDDFPLEQSQDESLRNAFDQVRSIDGRPLQSARPPSYPYFAILKDRLYRVTQNCSVKTRYNPVVGTKKPSGNAFPGGSL